MKNSGYIFLDICGQHSNTICDGKRAAKAPRVPSDALRRAYLNELQKQVNAEIDSLRFTIEGIVRENMSSAAEAVVAGNIDFMKEIGLPIQGAMSHVPADIVERVATGQIYAGNWSLSRSLWKQSVHTQRDVNEIIAKGIAENKSSYKNHLWRIIFNLL